jgi:hypothetical protein
MNSIIKILAIIFVITLGAGLFIFNQNTEPENLTLITVDSPLPNQVIESPLTIRGEARGTWFFEGSFPIVLANWDGLIVSEHFATAKGEWMTEEFVPFEAVLEFDRQTYSNRGSLILQKDNPSGMPEHDDAIEIPVLIGESPLEDNFKYDEAVIGYYGDLVVKGYSTVVETLEPFCQENCAKYNSVLFNITETKNESIEDYIGGQIGNSFVSETGIGIGCVENEIISRWNDSDEFGMKEYMSSTEISERILESTKEKPVTIQLTRFPYTGGRGAPACYSHFAEINRLTPS